MVDNNDDRLLQELGNAGITPEMFYDEIKRQFLKIITQDEVLTPEKVSTLSREYVRQSMAGLGRVDTRTSIKFASEQIAQILKSTYSGELGSILFFRRIRDAGKDTEDAFFKVTRSHSNSLFPKGIDKRYKKWLERNPRPETRADDVAVDQVDGVVATETPDDVEYLPMAADKFTANDEGKMLAGLRGNDEESPKTERVEAPHIKYVLEAIRGHYDIDGKINIHHAPENGEKDFDYSYKVIEFTEKDNGKTHHIVTNNWYGMLTAVVKDMGEFDPDDPAKIDVLELVHAGKAWTVRCINEDQYKQRIIELCDKSIEELSPQPLNVSWSNQRQAALDAMRGFFVETGQLPKSRELIMHGALGGRGKSFQNLYAALKNGSIEGLSDVTTKEALLDKVEEAYPDTKAHADKATIDARKLFADAVKFAENENMPPQTGLVDGMNYTLAEQNEETLSQYFGGRTTHGLTNLKDVLLPQFQNAMPQNLDDFIVMSGIGIQGKDGSIELAGGYESEALEQG